MANKNNDWTTNLSSLSWEAVLSKNMDWIDSGCESLRQTLEKYTDGYEPEGIYENCDKAYDAVVSHIEELREIIDEFERMIEFSKKQIKRETWNDYSNED